MFINIQRVPNDIFGNLFKQGKLEGQKNVKEFLKEYSNLYIGEKASDFNIFYEIKSEDKLNVLMVEKVKFPDEDWFG